MPDINKIFSEKLIVINMGLESFNTDLKTQDVQSMQVNWRPPSEASKKLSLLEGDSVSEKIDVANKEAIARLLAAEPIIVGIGTAGTHIPGMTKNTILHAGPPIAWEQMSEPLKGAIVGGLIYEGLVLNEEEGRILASSGEIIFDSCHHHCTVGPMAGVVTSSMPVWILKNKTFGNFAYCTLNEGLGKVLRFGAFSPEVIDRLNWMENILAPVLKEALEIKGSIDLKSIIAQSLQMGDEGHNRNKAGTSLLFRELAPSIVKTKYSKDEKAEVLTFIDKNDHFFLNVSMPACKCSLDPLSDIPNSTVVYAMSRNGTNFGIRVAGTGDEWFTAPCALVKGLYFPGFEEKDANPDIGDSCITETAGIGGFAMATAPAIVQFVGGTPKDAINYTTSMYEITCTENNSFKIPNINFRGTPTGIDIRKVIEIGILPVINTGIACNRAGIGQVGAGIVRPPMKCFEDALTSFLTKII
ncbi:DUF1116 domain-containing protein [Clostridium bowmanii]|uniref:DUF1116 domain-containing protein n=1 Tax=Clostridium bowmanii TaxID=132925 RepID=UPI001C0B401A|nr:DUF1116 domain-containing protein [Clostridium bowmanii]MBU3188889.1 DUF1116 domain-containing protein [Clostridium bowmanii]MCA1073706.1 DUF1116 domain-containing protein [Clostridium bowmanii]